MERKKKLIGKAVKLMLYWSAIGEYATIDGKRRKAILFLLPSHSSISIIVNIYAHNCFFFPVIDGDTPTVRRSS